MIFNDRFVIATLMMAKCMSLLIPCMECILSNGSQNMCLFTKWKLVKRQFALDTHGLLRKGSGESKFVPVAIMKHEYINRSYVELGCCAGFTRISKIADCKPCSVGRFGLNCTEECKCVGCKECHPKTGECECEKRVTGILSTADQRSTRQPTGVLTTERSKLSGSGVWKRSKEEEEEEEEENADHYPSVTVFSALSPIIVIIIILAVVVWRERRHEKRNRKLQASCAEYEIPGRNYYDRLQTITEESLDQSSPNHPTEGNMNHFINRNRRDGQGPITVSVVVVNGTMNVNEYEDVV